MVPHGDHRRYVGTVESCNSGRLQRTFGASPGSRLKWCELDLPKSAEPTSADPKTLYLGHTLEDLKDSPADLLGDQILSKPGDPDYTEVAALFPPIRKMPTYSFVGTDETMDKVGLGYGGRSPNFDPAPHDPAISKIRDQGQVMDGLVGGYLPILRFVYPEPEGRWTEMITFAPLRISNGNDRVQPVWYRIVHIENGSVKWAKYIDSYHPFPPRTEYDPRIFYSDLCSSTSAQQSTTCIGRTGDALSPP